MIYKKYVRDLKNYSRYLRIPEYSKNVKSSHHLFIINIMFEKIKKTKDQFFKYLKKNRILAQYHYIPIYKFSTYSEKKYNFPGSEKYFENSLSIPIYVELSKKDQNIIIKILKNYFK